MRRSEAIYSKNSKMPFTSIVVNSQLTLDAKKQLAAAVTKIFGDEMKVSEASCRGSARVDFEYRTVLLISKVQLLLERL